MDVGKSAEEEKVMLDYELAELYGVETKYLKRKVRRNAERFPEDFMFELTKSECDNLRSQIDSSSWGGTRYAPCWSRFVYKAKIKNWNCSSRFSKPRCHTRV